MQPIFNAQWRKAALDGDGGAIALLAGKCLEPLYRFCFYRVGRRRDLSEEVAQETLIRAIKDLRKYDPARSGNDLFPWLTGLARNEIQRALRREQNTASLQALWERMDDELRSLYALPASPLSSWQLTAGWCAAIALLVVMIASANFRRPAAVSTYQADGDIVWIDGKAYVAEDARRTTLPGHDLRPLDQTLVGFNPGGMRYDVSPGLVARQ